MAQSDKKGTFLIQRHYKFQNLFKDIGLKSTSSCFTFLCVSRKNKLNTRTKYHHQTNKKQGDSNVVFIFDVILSKRSRLKLKLIYVPPKVYKWYQSLRNDEYKTFQFNANKNRTGYAENDRVPFIKK